MKSFDSNEIQSDLAEIKESTARNDVNSAYLCGIRVLGKLLGASVVQNLETIIISISNIQDADHGMHPDLLSYRRTIYSRMINLAKKNLNPHQYQKFYQCF